MKSTTSFHPRNKHQGQYDIDALCKSNPDLSGHIIQGKRGNKTIDFFNPLSVKELNRALLYDQYGLSFWDVSEGYLCPPVPGRAEYIHHVAEQLLDYKKNITGLDIGTGSNLIYPIIGVSEYNWNFIASDIDKTSLSNAQDIIDKNPHLKSKIELRAQDKKHFILNGVINNGEYIDIVICNPPFHSSQEQADESNKLKVSNLKKTKATEVQKNFGGQNNELWCEGGEVSFIKMMITESQNYKTSCFWFTTLVSKKSNLDRLTHFINKTDRTAVKIIEMSQGNKQTRILAWTFLSSKQQKIWKETRWK